jgi:hypothetical protein
MALGVTEKRPDLNQAIPGFLHTDEWVWIDCEDPSLTPREGAQPLRAEFYVGLTVGEAMALPNPFNGGTTVQQVADAAAPFVRAWNLTAIDRATGEVTPVPPPIEGGFESFKQARPGVASWCVWSLIQLHVNGGPDRPNAETPSGDTPDGTNEDA